ncbi:alkaline phosphatase family protein [Propionibacteriaceae bacterium G1746]|uniref:alkaline phosphatase family protein n=1 Tax=Aestuariimicrobium sp. G57 TaxID=3418485 RepID=UPI003C1DD844
MTDAPLLPRWGHSTLADLLPSISAHLGLAEAGVPSIDLPASSRYVLVLVDGLGYDVLQQGLAVAPYCAGLFGDAQQLTATVPSTTATSLTSLGTGVGPAAHGMVGYSFRDPRTGVVFNSLAWDTPTAPEDLQTQTTWFERLALAGHASHAVVPARFDGSGLTRAALRGQVVSGLVREDDEDDLVARAVAASRAGDRSLVYVYERMLDHTAHAHGVGHPAWRNQLARIDAMLERLRAALDDDVVMLVTGDHGMVDVPADRRIIFEDTPALREGVDQFGGEGRFRQLYTTDPLGVAQRWASELGDRAWVRTRDEAIAEGWFGAVPSADVAGRIGDVVAAMRDDWAVMSLSLPGELALVGMHGSLTRAEMVVPLLVDDPAHDWGDAQDWNDGAEDW